jgi:hypothetical protein
VEVQIHTFFDLGTTWRWVVSFTPRSLYTQRKSPWYRLDRRLGGPQSRSERGVEEKNSQPLPVLEPRSFDHPARSQSLYQLSYSDYLLISTAIVKDSFIFILLPLPSSYLVLFEHCTTSTILRLWTQVTLGNTSQLRYHYKGTSARNIYWVVQWATVSSKQCRCSSLKKLCSHPFENFEFTFIQLISQSPCFCS